MSIRLKSNRNGLHKTLSFIPLIFLLAGCASPPSSPDNLLSENTWSLAPLHHNTSHQNAGLSVSDKGTSSGRRDDLSSQTVLYNGTGQLIGPGTPKYASSSQTQEEGVTLNLLNTPIVEASKTVLGDILKLNYSVGSRVEGKITIQTSKPVSRDDLIILFQNALRSSGATLVRNGDLYQIEPLDAASTTPSALSVGTSGLNQDVGSSRRTVQLKYISAYEMARILDPMVAKGTILQTDKSHNSLTLSGDGSQIANVMEVISVFDVDVMRGMSVAIVPVKTAQPEEIAENVRTIFGANKEGPMSSMVRFLPNQRLKSILVISPQSAYIARAEAWIHRLDEAAQGADKQLFMYAVQNRSAKELVSVIDAMFGSKSRSSPSQNVAPRFQQASTQTQSGETATSSSSNGRDSNAFKTPEGVGTSHSSPDNAASESTPEISMESERVRVTADEANNSLLILCSKQDYQRILRIIRSLDVEPQQVLIEATIAEVTLSDELQFGLRWYFQNHKTNLGLTNDPGGSFGSVYPGFSWARTAMSAQVTLNALNAITHVNVISSPSLTVLDNHTASLQVGDQVPIVTQSAVGVTTAGAPIVNSIAYRDTGIVLSITPRISDNGNVVLEIVQEVSSVSNTTTSNIDSPTIHERKIKTSVRVDDGDALALGGLIQNQVTDTRHQVPVLGDVPIVGNLFKQKNNTIAKTELIILLTPHVIRNALDAHKITDEYRRQLNRFSKDQKSLSKTLQRSFE